ncbi:lytic transglycosylase domain-containing protein [Aurantivibrio infirmus]
MPYLSRHHQKTLSLLAAGVLWLAISSFAHTAENNANSLQIVTPSEVDDTRPEVDEELRRALKSAIESSDSFGDRYDAEVWLVSKSGRLERFVKDPDKRFELLRSIHRAATQAKIQPEIVLAVIEIESRFDRYAISRVGAQGMMQIMPFWKEEIGHSEDNLFDIETNLKYGCTILKHYLDRSEGRLAEALARYNGSYGKYWYPEKVMVAWEKNWR